MPNIREISTTETYKVRRPELRDGKPIANCRFEGDELPTTKHFGLFEEETLAGIVSIFENRTAVFHEASQYQLRGMAVIDSCQKKGYGEMLVQHAENYLKSKNERLLWFNARIIALDFYKRLGYETIGGPFEIGSIGFHYVMYKKL